MAGFRLTLKKLAKKYGLDIQGLTYTKLIQEIVQDNVTRASKKMGDISNRRMKKAFDESIKDGIIELPEYAVPLVTLRKSAEDGQMITDTLRDTLTRGLRQSIIDNPNNTEKAIEQMTQSIKDNISTYQTSHAKLIAVTEVRSAVDLSKYAYVQELLNRNGGKIRVIKKWIHNDHLVKIPRPTHKAIDGEEVLFNQPFSIGLMYPHDPNAPASEVIGCQCGYRLEVEEMATNEIFKELKTNIGRLGEIRKEYPPHHISHRKNGDFEKQENGSWDRVTDPKEQSNLGWNKIAEKYGASSFDELTDDQRKKMSDDINSTIKNFIQENSLMIHNNGYDFATVGDVFEDGKLRTGHGRKDLPDTYLKKRKETEDNLIHNGESDPIYAEVNNDWKDSVASNFYKKDGAGIHFKLKDSVRDNCTYSLGDSLKTQKNFIDDPMSSDPDVVLSFINVTDDGVEFDKDALKNYYVESQIWKPVTKDDIDTVYINEDFYNKNKDWCDKNFTGLKIETGDY